MTAPLALLATALLAAAAFLAGWLCGQLAALRSAGRRMEALRVGMAGPAVGPEEGEASPGGIAGDA